MWARTKNFILDLLFPQCCLGCQKEETYFCEDCQACLEILASHQKYQTKNLSDLYFALPYQSPLIKNLIQKFKYQPFAKELAKSLASLIINHFQLIENLPPFFSGGSNFILIPLPLYKKKLKWRGFNQAEEIAKELSNSLGIPLINNILIKTKETLPQVELLGKEREENIKGVFIVEKPDLIKGRKILLVDDIFTTGSTMEECAKVLKEAGAKKITGIVVARAEPEENRFQNV